MAVKWHIQVIQTRSVRIFVLKSFLRANLRMALSGGGQPWTMSAYLEPDPKARDVAFLDQYAGER